MMKERANIKKHHISFNVAKRVFNDVNRIEIYDMQHSLEEDRYNTIGMVEDVLFVVYTERKSMFNFCQIGNRKGKEFVL